MTIGTPFCHTSGERGGRLRWGGAEIGRTRRRQDARQDGDGGGGGVKGSLVSIEVDGWR